MEKKDFKFASVNTSQAWQEYPVGLQVNEGGTSMLNRTGDWRTKIPYWDQDKCKQCLMCTPYCPDVSIPVVNGKRQDFDYDHCKGCGICYTVCPFKAIRWEEV